MSVPFQQTSEIPAEVQRQIQLAMLCGRVNCALRGSNIWNTVPCRGEAPTPAELIAWAAAETLRRLAKEQDAPA